MLQDAWFTVQQINDDTFAISEYGHWEKVHSFLLIGEDKAALIDTGLGIDSMKRITDQLTTKPIEVITTHVHVIILAVMENMTRFMFMKEIKTGSFMELRV